MPYIGAKPDKGNFSDLNGGKLIIDADADTSITADTDDQIDIEIAGADDFQFTANKFLVQTGSTIDMNGMELILDADADTSITASTDDQIDIRISGADDFTFTANTFTAASGSGVVIPDSGLTLGSTAVTSTAAELNTLDALSRGSILYGNASAATTVLTKGSADQVLTSDGTDLSWEDAGGGAVTALNNATQSELVTVGSTTTELDAESNLTFDGSTLTVTGAADISGVATATTFEPDGDTSTGDNAALGYTAALGAILTGQGSTNDVTLVNDADATVLGIPTGTTNVTIAGDLTLTGTTPTLTIGDAGTEDTSIVFDGNAQDYYIGLDDTDDDLKIGLGSTVGTTAHIVMDETGAVTKPLQPSFMVQPSATQSNIAVGVATTVTWDTEIYDIGGDFASNVFTAPVTGKYLFCVNIEMNQIDTAAAHYRIQMVFSNRTMQSWVMTPNFASDTTLWPACFSTHMDMDAGDTIEMRFDQPDGTAQTDISVSSFYTGSLLS